MASRVFDFLNGYPARQLGGADQTQRFLLIKAWGHGFWSDMNHVFGCLLLAEISNRIPVTHWGRNSLFSDGTDSDAFRLYFEPLSSLTIEDLQSCANATFFPPKWTAKSLRQEDHRKWEGPGSRLSGAPYLRRRETVAVSDFYIHLPDLLPYIPKEHRWRGKTAGEIYRLIANKHLRLRPHIIAEIEQFYLSKMQGPNPIVAVHVRGTDKFREPDYRPSLQNFFNPIDSLGEDWRIFLMTDQQQFLDAFRERYGSRLIFTDAHRSSNKTAVHLRRTPDQATLGTEIVKDTFLALRCQKFIGHGLSNPACIVSVLKDWKAPDCTLWGPSLLERNFSIRMRRRKPRSRFKGFIDRLLFGSHNRGEAGG